MSNPFDPSKLKLPSTRTRPQAKPPAPRHKPGEWFLKGPIPWDWLSLAASQSSKALHVAIALWFLVSVKKSAQVALSGSVLRRLGVSRYSAYRGLRKLEEVNLVRVERNPGRQPIVTVLDVSGSDGYCD